MDEKQRCPVTGHGNKITQEYMDAKAKVSWEFATDLDKLVEKAVKDDVPSTMIIAKLETSKLSVFIAHVKAMDEAMAKEKETKG